MKSGQEFLTSELAFPRLAPVNVTGWYFPVENQMIPKSQEVTNWAATFLSLQPQERAFCLFKCFGIHFNLTSWEVQFLETAFKKLNSWKKKEGNSLVFSLVLQIWLLLKWILCVLFWKELKALSLIIELTSFKEFSVWLWVAGILRDGMMRTLPLSFCSTQLPSVLRLLQSK